jgi:energy-coupling factor transport system ATP-binding protein
VTVLLAEHRLERVIGYVDRILLIEGEGKSSIGIPSEILKKTELVPPIVRLTRSLNLDEVGTSTREVRRITETLRNELPDSEREKVHPGEVLLSLRSLSATYGPAIALKDISLELKRGEITALMGRNGAGKSTLIKSIVALHKETSGEIIFAGEPIHSYSQQERSQRIGYIPQEPGDLLYLTSIQEECARADKDNGIAQGSTFALLRETLPGINPESHPRELSEGQRLALVLAIVISGKPELLILDEPTRGLDYEAKTYLMRQLHHLARTSNSAILMATHDVEIVAEVADRTIFIADGEKVADGPTLDVLLASPAFAPQVSKVMSPRRWLTVGDVLRSVESKSS